MQNALLAIGQTFSEATSLTDGLLAGIKTIILGGFEEHKIPASDMPAIQIIYKGSVIDSQLVGCTRMKATFNIHLVYNVASFTNEPEILGDKIKKITTSLLISDQVEKRANCEYDNGCICGVILNNQNLYFEEGSVKELVGYNWLIEGIEYGNFQRGSGTTYPTGEAVVSTSLFYNV